MYWSPLIKILFHSYPLFWGWKVQRKYIFGPRKRLPSHIAIWLVYCERLWFKMTVAWDFGALVFSQKSIVLRPQINFPKYFQNFFSFRLDIHENIHNLRATIPGGCKKGSYMTPFFCLKINQGIINHRWFFVYIFSFKAFIAV